MSTARICLLLLCALLLWQSPARGNNKHAAFIAGLRERQLYRLAELYIERELGKSALGPREQVELLIEQALTRAAVALDAPPRDRATAWDATQKPLDDYLKSQPADSLRLLIELQHGLVDLARGRAERGETRPAIESDAETARISLRHAIGSLTNVATQAAAQLRDRALKQSKPIEYDLTDDELRGIERGTALELARAHRQLGLSYPGSSADHDNALLAAEERLRPLATAATVDSLVWPARIELIEVLAELDRAAEGKSLAEPWGQPSPTLAGAWNVALVRLQVAAGNTAAAEQRLAQIPVGSYADADLARLEFALATKSPGEKIEQLLSTIRQQHSPYWARRAAMLAGEQLATTDGGDAAQRELAAVHYFHAGQLARAREEFDLAAKAWQIERQPDRRLAVLQQAAAIALADNQPAEAAQRYRQLAFGQPSHTSAPAWHRERLLALLAVARAAPTDPAAAAGFRTACNEHLEHWPTGAESDEVRIWLARMQLADNQPQAAVDRVTPIDAASTQYASALQVMVDAYRQRMTASEDASELASEAVRKLQTAITGTDNRWPAAWNCEQREVALLLAELRLRQSPADASFASKLLQAASTGKPEPSPEWTQKAIPTLALAQALLGDTQAAAATLEKLATAGTDTAIEPVLAELAARLREPDLEAATRLALANVLTHLLAKLPASTAVEVDRYTALAHSATDPAGALGEYRALLKKYPKSGDISEEYAQLLTTQPDAAAAILQWRRVEAGSHRGGERWYRARLARVRLLSKQGQSAEVKKLIDLTRAIDPQLAEQLSRDLATDK